MVDPAVRYRLTPEPEVREFLVEDGPAGEPRAYAAPEEARADPLAAALFAIPGVERVALAPGRVVVTKVGSASWDELVPRIAAVLREHAG